MCRSFMSIVPFVEMCEIDFGVSPRSATFESRQPPHGGSGGSVETGRSCDVHLAVDPVHGRDQCDGDESDDEPTKRMTAGSNSAVKCLSL